MRTLRSSLSLSLASAERRFVLRCCCVRAQFVMCEIHAIRIENARALQMPTYKPTKANPALTPAHADALLADAIEQMLVHGHALLALVRPNSDDSAEANMWFQTHIHLSNAYAARKRGDAAANTANVAALETELLTASAHPLIAALVSAQMKAAQADEQLLAGDLKLAEHDKRDAAAAVKASANANVKSGALAAAPAAAPAPAATPAAAAKPAATGAPPSSSGK